MNLDRLEKQMAKADNLKQKIQLAFTICTKFADQLSDEKRHEYYLFIVNNSHFPDLEHIRGMALSWLGNYSYRKSKFETSLEYLFEAKEIQEDLGDKDNLVITLNAIAVVYNALGQKDKSFALYEHILTLSDQVINVLRNYSDLLLEKKDYDGAFLHLEKALKLAQERKDQRSYWDCLLGYCNIYNQTEKPERSIEIIEENLDKIEKENDIRTVCFYYMNYSQALSMLGRYDEAVKALDKALELSELSGLDELYYFSYMVALDIYKLKNDADNQIKYLNLFMNLKDKLYSFKIKEKTLELEARNKKEKMLSETREILEKTKHMASLGIMASGITHEINQPLNAIMIEAQTLLYKDEIEKKMPESYRERIQYIIEGTERITSIINHIRSYWIRNDWVNKKTFEVNQTISNAIALVNQQVKAHGIYLKVRLTPTAVFIYGTPLSLEQSIINLIVNSIHALDTCKIKDKRITLMSVIRGESIDIHLEDNGPGIPEEIKDKIFEPFFTQKEVHVGTGLGLTLVQNFIKDLNGTISLVHEKKKGAHFICRIPIYHTPEFEETQS